MKLLLTGGAGYIGTHTIIELLEQGHDVVVVDNLSNASSVALERVEEIVGCSIPFYQVDITDKVKLSEVFSKEKVDGVIHFAGLKAVGESVEKPIEYYKNNVAGTITLLEVMKEHEVKNIVFSSSATVYGAPEVVPIPEDAKLSTTNPYGASKLIVEGILKDVHLSDPTWSVVILRYFNPIGAHKSGRIGEDPNGIPNNLIPYITQVAVGKLKELAVFGNDYDTEDGTGVRDYIHVVDLAKGHVASLKQFNTGQEYIYNLGTGQGYSVLDIVDAFSKVVEFDIPYKIQERRPGDISTCFADASKAFNELGWKAEYSLKDMSEDSWRWQKGNPHGYQ
ncbi:UDP-glucose 4-epimerase GalE [Erysipelothrix urinaevulpis]|uniref:UDP-glucose 4-epimerase GalE n=1 Tax=Erysipelothrix urinaevulpis TaxID=2683717 RepID=UPI0013584FE3|nr:UDP-glucose 4-epimerase GalE [Erysipelothrix urinaevulpis]